MGRRPVKLKVAKWVGTLMCALLAALYWVRPSRVLQLDVGALHVGSCVTDEVAAVWWIDRRVYPRNSVAESAMVLEFMFGGSALRVQARLPDGYVITPLYLPSVLMGVPMALIWVLDRRRILVGHCRKCGYDLTGNVSGRCPECGTAVGCVSLGDGERVR